MPEALTRYQRRVLLAAWIAWGFDVFDAMLFNLVAPNCVPTLLGLTPGSPAARHATLFWTGVLTSLLLVGWALGGALFGVAADRLGRRRTLLFTVSLYSVGTALCAAAPNLLFFAAVRFAASLGLGGEWAAGAAMVAEVVPDEKRVEAGAMLQTAAPLGLLGITLVNLLVAGRLLPGNPQASWRLVFLVGLLPALAALLIRHSLDEPERWRRASQGERRPGLAELFAPEVRRATWSGFLTNTSAQLTWWSTYAFIPIVATGLANSTGPGLAEPWKALAAGAYNVGGLLGTVLLVPMTRALGRRGMLAVYFLGSTLSVLAANGLALAPHARLLLYFPIGLSVYGIIGAFAFYLPELFPTRLRGTGAGFCFNAGRVVAAAGPFLVGAVAARGAAALQDAMHVQIWVALVPLATVLLLPTVLETGGRELPE